MNQSNLQKKLNKCESRQFSAYIKRFMSRIEALMKKKTTAKPQNLVYNNQPKLTNVLINKNNKNSLVNKLINEGFKKPTVVARKMLQTGRPSSDFSKQSGLLKKGK